MLIEQRQEAEQIKSAAEAYASDTGKEADVVLKEAKRRESDARQARAEHAAARDKYHDAEAEYLNRLAKVRAIVEDN
jgi:hypothetical protein